MKEKKLRKIEVDKIDLDTMKEKVTEMPGLIPFAHNVGGAIVKPEDKGKIHGRAISAMHDQTTRQMKQLYEQMQTLAQQAEDLKKRVELSERIYLSQMNFDPIIGKIYFLYQRKDGTDLLSMVSPKEWGRSFPFQSYLGKVQLLSDHTWEVLNPEEE